jgi:hypothetical protein
MTELCGVILKDMENLIFHFKEFNQYGNPDWIPFSLKKDDAPKWNLFCQKLSLLRPKEPDPIYSDYLEFLEQLKSGNLQ